MAQLSMDRTTGQRVATFGDRVVLSTLDAYSRVSTGWNQRGLYKACKLAGRTWTGRRAKLRLGTDAEISFPADDPYWNRMLLRSYDHEPELAAFLRKIAAIDYAFIDCGANIGYWSVFVAAPSCGGGKPVAAVEASASTFAILAGNAAAQRERITPIHRAIFDRSGEIVHLNSDAHEARGISGDAGGGERVETVCIDALVSEFGWSDRRLVIKLDVEGVEKEALAGMPETLRRDPLLIYEDHGSDPTNAITRHVLQMGLQAALLTAERVVPLTSADQLTAWKVDPTQGYNLVAMKAGSAWRATLA